MKAIEIEKLTKFYGNARGIENVDLSIEKGDFFGFIGPNGAGKSTTIRLLCGLIKADSGKASIFGKDAWKDKTEILSGVGYLPSESAFYKGMTVAQVIDFSAKMRKKDCSAAAKELCERFALDTARTVDSLSLGNRKKVGLVCALQHDPELYILDEPTSGLDPLMQREFYTVLKERNEKGATVFLSSHVLSEIARYCKTAAVIREGRILVCDSVDKLGHTGVKRVSLRGLRESINIEGIKDVRSENESVSFLYDGNVKMLLDALAKMDIADLNISDPELDEIFMHYYEKGENAR